MLATTRLLIGISSMTRENVRRSCYCGFIICHGRTQCPNLLTTHHQRHQLPQQLTRTVGALVISFFFKPPAKFLKLVVFNSAEQATVIVCDLCAAI